LIFWIFLICSFCLGRRSRYVFTLLFFFKSSRISFSLTIPQNTETTVLYGTVAPENTNLKVIWLDTFTLSYSSVLAGFRHYTVPGFPYNLHPVSCGDIGFLKQWLSSGLISGPKVPIGPSCPLQTILLSDLIGCGSPLQIVMTFWRTLFQI
jgi:hypothetical protein